MVENNVFLDGDYTVSECQAPTQVLPVHRVCTSRKFSVFPHAHMTTRILRPNYCQILGVQIEYIVVHIVVVVECAHS